MKNILIIYAHPDEQSYNAVVLNKIVSTIKVSGNRYQVIDLYKEGYNPVLSTKEMRGEISPETENYQQLISRASDIIFIFPVWWFRAPAILEGFIDKTFVPKFAYRFKKIIGNYGLPIPILKDKKVLAFITHGAPALPVKLLYLNVVKYRFLLGFLSFCFNIFKCKIVQLWSVPFCSDPRRKIYLDRVGKIVESRLGSEKNVKQAIPLLT
ncbi:MAG: NAD(P)H-dependent oxidoreductase [Ferruginibacter sp.]|nr:NAD(P)H-dependent oxidoreductase [Ferruginibacter sp.]